MPTDNTIPVAGFKDGPAREFTYGEKAVGLTFNPSGDPDVHRIKMLHAEIIDILDRKRKEVVNPSEKGAILTWGIREQQAAQMVAVKGITYQD